MNIVTISGTSRPDNYTARALAVVADELEARGLTVTRFDGRELELGFPGQPVTADANRLAEAVDGAAAVVLATPEYHGTFSAMTKLVIESLGFPSKLAGKPVALLGVAAGRIGAIKSLEHLRGCCAHVGAVVVPTVISIAGVRSVFDEQGRCTDEGTRKALAGLADSLTGFMKEYVCPKHVLEAMVRAGDAPGWATAV